MRDLFFSECRRYRRPALIFFVAHLMLLVLFGRVNDPLAQAWLVQAVILGAYALGGLGFALHQIGSYRQPGRWLWLMHRPLPRSAIFGAITVASATMIALAVGVPLLLAVLGTEWFSDRTVDLRHYVMVAYVVMIVIMAWLTGAAIMLGASRCAVLVVALPWVMLMHESTAIALLAMCVPCLVLMAAVVYTSFQPNRAKAPATGIATMLAALPLVLGLYLLAPGGVQFAVQLGAMTAGMHPQQMLQPPADSDSDLRLLDSRDVLRRGLQSAASGEARADRWRSELARVTPQKIMPGWIGYALPQQLSNKNMPRGKINDNQLFSFNHDTMRFDLTDLRTGVATASVGPGGPRDTSGFPAVPALTGKMMLPHAMLDIDTRTLTFATLATLPANEIFMVRPVVAVDTAYAVSNQRLIAYRTAGSQAPYQELYSVPLDGPLSDMARIDVARLSDGVLASFTGGRDRSHGAANAGRQTLVFVAADGKRHTIATREIKPDYPPLLDQIDWWMSPVLEAVTALPARILPGTASADHLAAPLMPQRSGQIWTAAVLSNLLAATGAWLWRRRALRQPGHAIGAGWLPACLVFGLPCLAAMMIMYPHRSASRAPAKATAQQVVAV